MISIARPVKKLAAEGTQLPSAAVSLNAALPGARTRVAIITPWHPEPVDNGSKQRIRQLVAALADTYDLVLISLLPPEQWEAEPCHVSGVWQQHALPLPAYRPRSARALFAALHPMPRSFAATWDARLAAAVGNIIAQAGVQLAIGADLRVLHYLLALPDGMKTLLDEANTSPFLSPTRAGRGLAAMRAASRQRKYERLLGVAKHRLDAAIVASVQEAEVYQRLAGSSRVTIIENAAAKLPEPSWRTPAGRQLIYAGSLTYGPNAEAVDYFMGSVLPLVEREISGVRLTVTGKMPAKVLRAGDPRLVLTGQLEEAALDATYRASRVCVVPLLSGTGTRIKLLEALALGIPVVSTSKGAEGLDLTPGEEYLCADTPADFAAATVRLLSDAPFAEALGARGRERIGRDYTWVSRGQQLRDLVRECLAREPRGEE